MKSYHFILKDPHQFFSKSPPLCSSLDISSVNVGDHVDKAFEFLVGLDAWVVDVRGSAKILGLGLAVLIGDAATLLRCQAEELAFILGGKTLEVGDSLLHLILKEMEERIVLVLHEAAGDTGKSRLESSLLNALLGSRIFDGFLDLLE